jgi:hypothetical protein
MVIIATEGEVFVYTQFIERDFWCFWRGKTRPTSNHSFSLAFTLACSRLLPFSCPSLPVAIA